MNFHDLGLISYDKALTIQLTAVDNVLQGGDEQVFLLEHYPVITLGRNQSTANLLKSEDSLRSEGIELVRSSRGGDITCHFPGQLVIYPVMRMAGRPGGIRTFFHNLEQVVINVLFYYGINSWRRSGRAGVFTLNGKIASMGIAVKKGVSYHGIALNLHQDLGLFDCINPCGYKGMSMSSIHMELEAYYPDMDTLKNDFCREFRDFFEG